jgi:hypothetical protein
VSLYCVIHHRNTPNVPHWSFLSTAGLASGYLNQPEVMAAIHVRDPGFCWAVCNTAPTWKYTVSALYRCMGWDRGERIVM